MLIHLSFPLGDLYLEIWLGEIVVSIIQVWSVGDTSSNHTKHTNTVGLYFPCSWKIIRLIIRTKQASGGSRGHEQFFASELLLARIYGAMNECVVLSFLSMLPISLLSISSPICTFSMLFFLFPYYFLFFVWFGRSYIQLCAFWCVRPFCVNLICLTKVAVFIATLSTSSKGSYQQVSPTPEQRVNGLRRIDVVPAIL